LLLCPPPMPSSSLTIIVCHWYVMSLLSLLYPCFSSTLLLNRLSWVSFVLSVWFIFVLKIKSFFGFWWWSWFWSSGFWLFWWTWLNRGCRNCVKQWGFCALCPFLFGRRNRGKTVVFLMVWSWWWSWFWSHFWGPSLS
jgi:hypothetical protein